LKKGLEDGDFFGVVIGLLCACGSLELISDLEESDGRLEMGVGTPKVLLEGPVVEVDRRGEAGSSRGARDGRLLSSLDNFRKDDFMGWADDPAWLLSGGRSCERRSLVVRPIRDDFFLGLIDSPVGAVVIISGAATKLVSR
jgi:hypothetical protein